MTLGDNDRYLSATPSFSYFIFLDSTLLTDFLSGTLSSIFGMQLCQFFFFNLSFFGFYHLLRTANFTSTLELKILAFSLLPSYSIWSSIAGKEAITIFITSYIAAGLIQYYNQGIKRKYLFAICCWLLLIFKPQYIPAFAIVFLILTFRRYISQSAFMNLLLLVILSLMMIYFINIFYDKISLFSLLIPEHFSESARLTRENIYFREAGDVFKFRPDYWSLSFFGISFLEAKGNPVDLIFFLEGLIIFSFIFYLMIYKSRFVFSHARVGTLNFIIFIFLFGLLLIAHYPMGIMNPGSSMRYRSGFLMALIVLMAYFPALSASPHIKDQRKI
ncbi:hypothetical protein OAC37_02060 [Amylibacter sp.]|nr:hypothetical protein [Amylibacter sp.]